MLITPFLFVANVVFVLFWLLTRKQNAWLSAIVVLVGVPLMSRAYKFKKTTEAPTSNQTSFSVLSYNTMYCDVTAYVHENNKTNAQRLVATLDTLRADIKCFQELYNWDDFRDFRTIYKLTDTHPYYTYMHSTPTNNEGQGELGLAIFSRFPIINKKEIFWKKNNNGVLQADVVVKKDTIRVMNVQLHSMGIRIQKVFDAKQNEALVKAETKNILSLLKNGFEKRKVQTDEITKLIQESPYPVILCGDFNEIPFGYAYGNVRNLLKNAFEHSGKGFGFTYNKKPKFIRIDNQFYDDSKIKNLEFETLDDIPYSDHYPLLGRYEMK